MDATVGDCWRCKKPAKNIKCETCGVAEYCSSSCRNRDRNIHQGICCNATALLFCGTCKKKSSDLKTCKGCYSVVYCNTHCQKQHWNEHKQNCQMFYKHVEKVVNIRRKNTEMNICFTDLPWYLGSTIAEDYLNLAKNEGCNYSSSLRLLFAGVGDIKDVILTVNNIPKEFTQKIEFVLNDYSPHVMARNILFLYCAIVNKEITHLIQIWYSLLLTNNCLQYLISVLKTLVESSKEDILNDIKNLVILDSHWEICRDIWKGWLNLAYNRKACLKIVELRKMIFERSRLIEKGLDSFTSTIPQIHKSSLLAFFKNGLQLPQKTLPKKKALHGNPTMTCFNPFINEYNEKFPDINQLKPIAFGWVDLISSDEEMIYSVRDDAFVYNCWDYLEIKKVVGLLPDINEMFIMYLEKIFTQFSSVIKRGNIKCRMIIDDFQKLDKYLPSSETFDRIATSNLCDYFPTPFLLEKFSPYLNRENKCSVLISREENWSTLTSFLETAVFTGNSFEAIGLAQKDLRIRSDVLEGLSEPLRQAAILQYTMCIEDYCRSSSFVLSKVIADILVYQQKKLNLPPEKSNFKHPSLVAQKLGIYFRDFRLELNHVIPFCREGNIRKISIMRNHFRYLEWSVLI